MVVRSESFAVHCVTSATLANLSVCPLLPESGGDALQHGDLLAQAWVLFGPHRVMNSINGQPKFKNMEISCKDPDSSHV